MKKLRTVENLVEPLTYPTHSFDAVKKTDGWYVYNVARKQSLLGVYETKKLAEAMIEKITHPPKRVRKPTMRTAKKGTKPHPGLLPKEYGAWKATP